MKKIVIAFLVVAPFVVSAFLIFAKSTPKSYNLARSEDLCIALGSVLFRDGIEAYQNDKNIKGMPGRNNGRNKAERQAWQDGWNWAEKQEKKNTYLVYIPRAQRQNVPEDWEKQVRSVPGVRNVEKCSPWLLCITVNNKETVKKVEKLGNWCAVEPLIDHR